MEPPAAEQIAVMRERWSLAAAAVQRDLAATPAAAVAGDVRPQFDAAVTFYVGDYLVRSDFEMVVDSLAEATFELASEVQDLLAGDAHFLWPVCAAHDSFFGSVNRDGVAVWQCRAEPEHGCAIGALAELST